ncbi:MAG: LamG-like jellyroll fold domain-containing protein [Promethearchaeota archaeon]
MKILLIILMLNSSIWMIFSETSSVRNVDNNLFSPNAQDDQYYAEFNATDEDYVNFSSMAGFTYGNSWSIVQRLKLPESPSIFGWNWFRGSAWDDKEGDIALQLRSDDNQYQIYFWFRQNGWNSLFMNKSQNGINIQNNTWYDIVVQFNRPNSTYQLYLDGNLVYSLVHEEMDDTSNQNPLFFGGQYADPEYYQGDLYSESDIAIVHQAWFQRVLTQDEIKNYHGQVDNTDEDLFFSTNITNNQIFDASGNGHNGENGNSPEYIVYVPKEYPTITSPNDITYVYDETEQSISWTVTDNSVNGQTYSISVNGTEEDTGTWTSGTAIIFNVTGWEVGNYDVVITANDGLGCSVQDTVIVSVTQSSTQSSFIISGYTTGFLLITLFGVVVILIKKRK